MKRNRKNVFFEIKKQDCIKKNKELEAAGSLIRYTPYTFIQGGCYVGIFGQETYYKRWYSPNREGLLKRLKTMKKIKHIKRML